MNKFLIVAITTVIALTMIEVKATVATQSTEQKRQLNLAEPHELSLAEQKDQRTAPIAISGDDMYIAWWTNDTANNNEDVMFRSSNDGGVIFIDKINLSNSTGA